MAHFVRHVPTKYELDRGESFKHMQYRKAFCHQHAEMEKSRARTSGLWWSDQRYVDQVVPAHFVHPDFLDTFNYRYQVYARPPPLQVAPRSLAEASDQQPPVSYNVKRMAVDKVWAPGNPMCAHHWSRQPWQVTCCPPINRETAEDCSRNNKPLHGQPSLTGRLDGMCPVLHETATFNSNKGQLGLSNVDFLKNQNSPRNPGSCHAITAHSPGGPNSWDNQANNNSTNAVDSRQFGSRRRQYQQSKWQSSNMMNPVEHLGRQGTGACRLADSRTEIVNAQSETACMAARRAIANHNKNWASRDSVASLLCNHNNNRTDDLTNESGRMVIVDNLIGTDNEDIINNSRHPHTTFTVSQRSQFQPGVYCPDDAVNLWSPSSHLWYTYSLCRNNNAEGGNVLDERPGCIPRQCCDHSLYTQCQLDTPEMKTFRKPNIRATPCMELLGHLQSRTKPRCFIYPTPKPADRRSSEVTTETAYDMNMYDLGYKTYKIIGGKQYRLPPPKDYTADVELPRHLEEYREFTRRCPNPQFGRLDRSDPANEMLLPGHITSNLIKVRRSPFVYTRNPKCYSFSPLFYTPRETGDLVWSFPSAMLNQ